MLKTKLLILSFQIILESTFYDMFKTFTIELFHHFKTIFTLKFRDLYFMPVMITFSKKILKDWSRGILLLFDY